MLYFAISQHKRYAQSRFSCCTAECSVDDKNKAYSDTAFQRHLEKPH